MKTALLLSGGIRNLEHTIHYFKKHIKDCDIFFYGLENKSGRENNIKLLKELGVKDYIMNDSSFYAGIDIPEFICKRNETNINTMVYSFYNVMKCFELCKNYSSYDYIIRCRCDVFFFRDITYDDIIMSDCGILVPYEWNFKTVNPFAVTDIFTISTIKDFEIYSNCFMYLKRYFNECIVHPESIMGYHLMVNKMNCINIERHFKFEYPDEFEIPTGFDKHNYRKIF